MSDSKFDVVFVLGGPGAGKGTQSTLINEKYGYVHLSAGDLLRAERASGSELAEMIESYIVQGTIVPAEVTVNLLRNAMIASGGKKFLVDGFPRDPDNLATWEKVMTDATVQFLLFLDCPESTMEARLLERGKTSGRSDDNAEAIRKRFKTYEEQTKPIIDHFRTLNKVEQVLSTATVEEVFASVQTVFDRYV
jgi:UMP-CMP kinase